MKKKRELYFKYIDLMQNTENNRTSRLNTFLVINTLFVVAWAQLVIGNPIATFISIFIVLPGIFYAKKWEQISKRTNGYLESYRETAKKLQSSIGIYIISVADSQATEYVKENKITDMSTSKAKPKKSQDSNSTTFSKLIVELPIFFGWMFGFLLLVSITKFFLQTFTSILKSYT